MSSITTAAAHSLSVDLNRTTQSQRRLLRLRAVMDITGLCKTAVYKTPGFPRPLKLTSSASAWVASEVDAWIAERVSARDASQR